MLCIVTELSARDTRTPVLCGHSTDLQSYMYVWSRAHDWAGIQSKALGSRKSKDNQSTLILSWGKLTEISSGMVKQVFPQVLLQISFFKRIVFTSLFIYLFMA